MPQPWQIRLVADSPKSCVAWFRCNPFSIHQSLAWHLPATWTSIDSSSNKYIHI